MDGFAHLAVRSCYSLRDGALKPRALAEAVAERGMDAVGVADRGGLYGAVRLADACARAGIRPIFGTDLALVPDWSRPGWETSRGGRTKLARTGASTGGLSSRIPATPTAGANSLRARATRAAGGSSSRLPAGPASGGAAGPVIPGSGATWLEDDAARVTFLARTRTGYATLCRLVTAHHLESERSDPHLSWDALATWVGGVGGDLPTPDGGRVRRVSADHGITVVLADDSPVCRLLDAERPDAAADEARRWMELAGAEHVVIGITHHLAAGDDDRARRRFALADHLGLRAVANQVPRYRDPADARVADVLEAIRLQVPVGPRHSSRRNAEGYLKTPAEMARVFAERPDALRNAAELADACRVDLDLGSLRVPDYVGLGEDAHAELTARCRSGVHERYAVAGERHHELLERELAMVAELGLAPYFLTVAEVVDRIREKGIMAACRGSAAGSLICYALGISDVDPIAHDLTFERFMNPYRDELPDIDVDVESARREDIYRDLLDRYGTHRVACVCMVETFKARMAIREVGKALGLPANEVDYVAKSFPHVRAGDVRAALEHLPEMKGLRLDAGQLGLLFDVVERMDGFPRHIALHPCGILLGDSGLRDLVPMERSAAGFAMAQFDKDDVEALGLCKLDVLSVRMLSSMAHAVEEVERVRGETVDFAEVPWDDAPTYELIQSTRTLGMFQIESPGQRELVGKFQPEHLSDLVVDISLFRPGPVKGDMVGPFLQRRLGQSKTVMPHPLLEPALGETFGVIVYHEQVMRSVAALTGCDLATADLVRRRLGDPDEVPRLERWLLDAAVERGVERAVAESLWHALAQFASFGFCKAHAAAFAVPTYRSAWLKRHYLPEFVAGLLTHDPGMYPRRLILDDARQFGVCVLPVDVNASGREYRVERLPWDEALLLLGVQGGVAPTSDAAGAHGSAAGSVSARGGVHGDAAEPGETKTLSLPRGWKVKDGALVPPGGWDFGVDPADPSQRFGVRLGLQDVAGIDDAQIESLLAGRPFADLEDLRRRAALSQPVAEALAHVGALEGLTAGRSRRDVLLEVAERWSGLRRHRGRVVGAPEQGALLGPEPAPGLPDYTPSEQVRAELEVLGVESSRHVITFYDDLLDVLDVTRTVDLLATRNGERVRVAGVKVATQTPPVKSGQRIIFLSLDDATGVNDATFFESVHDRCAWTVFHTWLLVVEGTVHRSGKRGVSLNAERVWDLRRLMRAWQEGWLDRALREVVGPGGRPRDERAAREHHDGAPSEGLRGAPGRSGLALPGRAGRGRGAPGAFGAGPAGAVAAEGEHTVLAARAVAEGARDDQRYEQAGGAGDEHGDGRPTRAVPTPWGDPRRVNDELRRGKGEADPGERNGKPLDRLEAVPGSATRVGPNGTTWADPARRHPGVDEQDLMNLPEGHPYRPDRVPADQEGRPAPPRKLRKGGADHRDEPWSPVSGEEPSPRPPPDHDDHDPGAPPRKLWHASGGSAGR